MMYTTYAKVTEELGQNSTLLLSDLNQAAVEAIISEQALVIDDMIQRVETVPFEGGSVPNVIQNITLTFVKYKIWTRKAPRDIPDWLQKEYDNAFKLIKMIQDGKISLGTLTDYSDDEDDLEEGGLTENLRWASNEKYFTEDL